MPPVFRFVEHQQIVRGDAHHRPDRLAVVLAVHQLADAVDQHILVVDGGQPLGGGMNLDDRVLLLVAQDAGFGLGGQREDRMRHRGDIRSRRHIEDIENEEIADRMALREQGGRHDLNASVRR